MNEPEIAGVILEPMLQAAAGMRPYDAELLRSARDVTRRHGIPLIFDEVVTGYGRTGPFWASEHARVEPDILCLAKGFTAGMLPMSATLTTHEVFAAFLGDASRAFFHGHTYCGNPLGARVAREVLAVYRDERILERARPKSEKIRAAFTELGSLPGVTNVRSLGMMAAFELGQAGYLERAGWLVYEEALRRGAYLRPLGEHGVRHARAEHPGRGSRRAPRDHRRVGARSRQGRSPRYIPMGLPFWQGKTTFTDAPPRNVVQAAPWSVILSRVDSRIQPSGTL
jgi:adenosylmethionine-8-amino-7-oxononanoate aminotransferase